MICFEFLCACDFVARLDEILFHVLIWHPPSAPWLFISMLGVSKRKESQTSSLFSNGDIRSVYGRRKGQYPSYIGRLFWHHDQRCLRLHRARLSRPE